jgi:hypothetical protein
VAGHASDATTDADAGEPGAAGDDCRAGGLLRTEPGDSERNAAHPEADRYGAAAAASRFGVQLHADDTALVALAAAAASPIESVHDAADSADLREHENRCEEGLHAFVAAGSPARRTGAPPAHA